MWAGVGLRDFAWGQIPRARKDGYLPDEQNLEGEFMATEEEAIALLIENWQTPDFTAARIQFGDNAAILRGRNRLREMGNNLELARTQGAAVDALRKKLVQVLLTYQTTLQEALTASAAPLVITDVETAISTASALIGELDTPTRFETLAPSFADCLPVEA